MTGWLAPITVVPPLAAIALAFLAKSKATRNLLLAGGFTSLIVFSVLQIATLDCAFNEFALFNCATIPDAIARAISPLQIIYALAYFFLGPVLLVVAAILEMIARLRS